MNQFLRVYPLGGVGEIGSNMTVFETQNYNIVVDYGILFPNEDFFDIRYLIVDISDLKTEKETILFITHGHEDHIGAVHHFLKEHPDTQIYAPEFASILIRRKLEQRDMCGKIKLYDESDILNFDEFELHPLHVTHSIPETFGLIFKSTTASRGILFISDFKFDLNPLYEEQFDVKKLKEVYCPLEQRIAFLDSTNILNENKTLSESSLTEAFEDIFERKQRTFITMFSSNIYRLKNILEQANKAGKKITTIGRSIGAYLSAAEEAKLINLEDYKITDFDAIQNYDDPNLVLIVTGSQGEFLGAMRRILNGDQKSIHVSEHDLFVFSSKPIPGNEKKIYKMYNQIAEYGASIINFRDMQVHASGHPGQEDLKNLIDIIDPTDYIPIHGETYFLRKHIDFINKHYPHIKTHYLENFQGIDFSKNPLAFFNFNQKDPLLIHGADHVIEREKISERRKLSNLGLVTISISLKSKNIAITTKGLPVFIDKHTPDFKDLVHEMAFNKFKNRDHDYTCEQIRIKTRTYYNHLLGYKPIAIVHLI